MNMSNTMLRLFTEEDHKHKGRLVYDWLLETARELGIPGGSAFRAIAGYGHHGRIHEDSFFELAGRLPVEVMFAASAAQADALLARIADEGLQLFYIRTAAETGTTGVR
jgi:PII-like signaling protein